MAGRPDPGGRGSLDADRPTSVAGRRGPIDAPRSSGSDNLGRPSPDGRGRVGGIEHTEPLRDLAARDPGRAKDIGDAGRVVSHGTRTAIETGVSVALGTVGCGWGISAGYWDDDFWIGFWGGYGGCYSNYWYWWGCGGYPYSYYCHPFSYPYYCYYGYWPSVRYWYPDYYYPAYYSYPAYAASTITYYVYDDYDDGYDDGGTEVYVDVEGDEGYAEDGGAAMQETYTEPAQGEGVALAPPAPSSAAPAPGPDSVARATTQYLTLGDQAFREGRFADAVHFYARAVQFAPEDGVVWLVLSDGLLATGDYNYGAYALRKALELDPTLAETPLDKHSFYADGAEFDRQLAVLEVFVEDHPESTDALLMLAANYLFGGRPAACADLLGEPRVEALRGEPAGQALLTAAEAIQHGK